MGKKCKLEIDHPNFRKGDSLSLLAGLTKLVEQVGQDHTISGWVNHPMPHFPDYQNKIWKWDFRPEGERASTRKGWRLYAWVPDPDASEPVQAIAFVCYDKDETPKGDHPSFLAKALKKFLVENRTPGEEERFRRQITDEGKIVSLCLGCCEVVIICTEEAAVLSAEEAHNCNP